MNRRKFIFRSSLLTFAGLTQMHCKIKKKLPDHEIGLQLYTVRKDLRQDLEGTLTEIAKIGYTHVESAGYHAGHFYSLPRKEYKLLLEDLGLKQTSGHTRTGFFAPELVGTMTNQWERVCEDAAYMGQKAIINPWYSKDRFKTKDDYKKLIELYNKCGEMAKKYDLDFCHHNHDFEFETVEGTTIYDLMLSEMDPDLVQFEIDLYWIRKGGKNALDYFTGHPKRFPYWHIKDMDDKEDKFFTEVGNGVIDWQSLFAQRGQSGLKHFYVEQDDCRNFSPMESIAISHRYLDKNQSWFTTLEKK